MYHKQLISRFENEPEYQQLPTNKLNQILYQTGELLSEYLLRRTNEKCDEQNALKYKIIPVDYVKRSKPSNNENKLDLVIKILDHIIARFGSEDELFCLVS